MTNKQTEESKVENKTVTIEKVIEKLEKNDFTIYFYCPPMNIPSGGISVIFNYAQTLKKEGFNISIVYEPREDKKASYEVSQKQKKAISVFEKFNPEWLGDKMNDIEIKCLTDVEAQFTDGTKQEKAVLNVNPEDFLIIPEGFPNIMESTANLPCKRIVLAQSWYYILNGMQIGQKWQNFNIKDVISVSDGISEYLNAIMPGLNIKKATQSIDRNIFKNERKISKKNPSIVFMPGRSYDAQVKTLNVIKTFYAFYPQYRWIRFIELKGLSKEEFAERLSESAIALYTDEIAGFGTFPLEAMAVGTHVVGWAPLGGKEYMSEKNGFWTTNGDIFKLAELLGFAVEKYITSQLDIDEVQNEYEITLSKYSSEIEKEQIIKTINEYKNERIEEIKNIKQ